MTEGKIYSIGYQDSSVKKILAILDRHKIDVLIDVRTTPYSKWLKEFSLPSLKRLMGDRHQWMGRALGGWSKAVLTERMSAYNFLIYMIRGGEKNVCLMCVERNPKDCHRKTLLARELKEFFEIDVLHLNGEGEVILENVTLKSFVKEED